MSETWFQVLFVAGIKPGLPKGLEVATVRLIAGLVLPDGSPSIVVTESVSLKQVIDISIDKAGVQGGVFDMPVQFQGKMIHVFPLGAVGTGQIAMSVIEG